MAKKKIVFLTGSGMSVECGIPTFRGNGGLWDDVPVEKVASHDGWEADPEFVNNFYNKMRRKQWPVEPCEGHKLIAQMEQDYDVTVVTQNVDGLHEKAGSTHIIHLHGELSKACSSRDPYDERYIKQLTPEDSDIQPGEKAADGSLMRPYIVFFGEAVPKLTPAIEAVAGADVLVVIGTSLVVYPAASLLQFTHKGVPIYVIDPEDVSTTVPVTHIKKSASEGMRELLTLL